MRSYLILQEKVEQFNEDVKISALIEELSNLDHSYTGPAVNNRYSDEKAAALRRQRFDPHEMSQRGRRYEELDQLVMELLLGARKALIPRGYMTRSVVLGVDSSTQSTKVLALDLETGEAIGMGRAPHNGADIQSPEEWWRALRSTVH